MAAAIHINSIPGKDGQAKQLGPNPFENLALLISEDGKKGKPIEWNGDTWVFYSDLEPFEINQQPLTERGKHFRLSYWYQTFNWVADRGFENFSTWIG